MITIDETKLPENLFVTGEDGTKTLDYSKIKTQADVDAVLTSKNHVKDQLNAFKQKYKGVDLAKYNDLLANELEANRDILANPVYKNLQGKYGELQNQLQGLQKEIQRRDQQIADSELKQQIRSFKGVEPTAVDDILYRLKSSGVSKTERGFLGTDGNNVETLLSKLQTQAPHLFKRTVGLRDEEKYNNRQQAFKNNSLRDVLANCPTKTI